MFAEEGTTTASARPRPHECRFNPP